MATITPPKRTRQAPQASLLRRAFSLVELLVVLAITTILLGLLFGPIISSFNLTRRARAVAQAQDVARFGLERMTRELGQATYIYDNGLSLVAIPMRKDITDGTTTVHIGDSKGTPDPTKWPTIKYGRIDIVEPATRDNGNVIDPTTAQPVGGAEIQPGVRGKKVIRYFLGLKYPLLNGAQDYYRNNYEFPAFVKGSDSGVNPLVLYRAEYDPSDPNLFDMTYDNTTKSRKNYASTAVEEGGFNDPAFFYNTNLANTTATDANGNPLKDANGNTIVGNGNTYGANWRAISQVVLTSENMDLLRWNRLGAATNRGQINLTDPFAPTVAFAPVSVPGDVATPGFLTSGGVETPSAVPTLYQTKYGAWAYPYTITVTRGSTTYNGALRLPPLPVTATDDPFGTLSLTLDRDANGNVFVVNNATTTVQSSGTLTCDPAKDLFTLYSPATHKLLIKTPNLTFAIDTERGRVETGFAPLMGARNSSNIGVPYYLAPGGSTTPAALPVMPTHTNAGGTNDGYAAVAGETVPTYFRINTRDPQATPTVGGTASNQGILGVDLFQTGTNPPAKVIDQPQYLAVDDAIAKTTTSSALPTVSPLQIFGNNANTTAPVRGIHIVVGTDQVYGPDDSETLVNGTTVGPASGDTITTSFVTYSRVPALSFAVQPKGTADLITNAFPVYTHTHVYNMDWETFPSDATLPLALTLTFDQPGTGAIGLPARRVDETDTTKPEKYLKATYQWQNNFSRDPRAGTFGQPLDAQLQAVGVGGPGTQPEADIFRVDYATRAQYSVALGVRVYDPTDGRVQSIQVSDKVLINNALR